MSIYGTGRMIGDSLPTGGSVHSNERVLPDRWDRSH
jgi:hypothetical protein